jgi:hypothetical protein
VSLVLVSLDVRLGTIGQFNAVVSRSTDGHVRAVLHELRLSFVNHGSVILGLVCVTRKNSANKAVWVVVERPTAAGFFEPKSNRVSMRYCTRAMIHRGLVGIARLASTCRARYAGVFGVETAFRVAVSA